MADLKQYLNKQTTIQLLDDGEIVSEHREYLGMSQAGHPCARYLWYSFRWAYVDSFSRRIMRLFKRGHREEAVIVKDLQRIGYKFYGDQDEAVCAWGHCRGHRDGVVENVVEAPKTPHLAEFKTMSDKYFKDICKKGVRVAKPVYYVQCQLYMKFFKLKRTLFIAVNKNDDSYYVERLRYDAQFANDVVRKIEFIIIDNVPPKRAFDATWFECKFCAARQQCHYNEPVERNCRTCTNAQPIDAGYWQCNLHEKKLDIIMQRKGCDKYNGI